MKVWQSVISSFIMLTFLTPAQAWNKNIINFPQLVRSVETGQNVRAIIFLKRCVISDQNIEPELIERLVGTSTGFNFNHFLHVRDNFNESLIDSVTTTRKTLVEGPKGEFLTLFSSLRIFEDNTAKLRMVFFDPILQKQRLAVNWLCNINDRNLDLGPNLDLNFSQEANLNQNINLNQDINLNLIKNNNQLDKGLVLFNF